MNKSSLRENLAGQSGRFLFAVIVLQPMLDVLSYFMNEYGSTTVTTVLRALMLFAICAYGFIIEKDRRVYLISFGIIGGFWLAHALNCFRLGYLDPLGDLGEYLKLIQFPLWALAFISICRRDPDMARNAAGLLAINFGIILLVIALSYLTGHPAYTYDIPSRGVKLGLLGWFSIPNAQSAILAMLLPGIMIWAWQKEKLWLFCLACGAGSGLLFLTGTRLAYYAAVLVSVGFLVLILIGRQKLLFCVPLVIVLGLLAGFRGVSPMTQRQAIAADSHRIYQEKADAVMGDDKDYEYTGEPIPPEIEEKITRVYEEVYSQRNFADAPLLGDLLERFGTQRVMEHYRWSTQANTLYIVRTKKLAAMAMLWEEQDPITKLLGVEYARATLNGNNYDPENDFPGLLYFYGWLGAGLYAGFAIFFPLITGIGCLKNLRRLGSYLTVPLGGWVMLYILGFGAAQFSGQALRKPSVTVYLSLTAAVLYHTVRTSRDSKPRVHYERRAGLTIKRSPTTKGGG